MQCWVTPTQHRRTYRPPEEMGQSSRAQILSNPHTEGRQPYSTIRPTSEQWSGCSHGRGHGYYREAATIPGARTAERAGIPKRGSAGTVCQTDRCRTGRPQGKRGLLLVPPKGPRKPELRQSSADQPDPPECQDRTARTYGKTRDVRRREEDPL